jgi:hypothetical protein
MRFNSHGQLEVPKEEYIQISVSPNLFPVQKDFVNFVVPLGVHKSRKKSKISIRKTVYVLFSSKIVLDFNKVKNDLDRKFGKKRIFI